MKVAKLLRELNRSLGMLAADFGISSSSKPSAEEEARAAVLQAITEISKLPKTLYCEGEVIEIYERHRKDRSRQFLKGWVWGALAGAMFVRWVLPLFFQF